MTTSNVWFVTGASKGLGLTLTRQLLAAGYRVAATSRSLDSLTAAVGEQPAGRFLPLAVDLADEQSVRQAVEAAVAQFGRLDVVVNNAGYLQFGTIEELTDAEFRQAFDVNVFGAVNVIRHVMPQLRRQQRGHIFNVASVAGYFGEYPGSAAYSGAKFALVGISEALAAEARPFGIRVTAVYPGVFRTSFLSDSSLMLPKAPIADYAEVRAAESQWTTFDGQQPGDPDKAAGVLRQVSEAENPPLHLFLGPDAYETAVHKEANVQQQRADWQAVATATGF